MTKEEAQELGQEAADFDMADGIIDQLGNVIEPEALKDHIRDQIVAKVESTDLPIQVLRELLEAAQGVRNDNVGLRFTRSIERRLFERFGDRFVRNEGGEIAPDQIELFQAAWEAYDRRVLAVRKHHVQ